MSWVQNSADVSVAFSILTLPSFPVSIRDGRLNRAPMSKIEDFLPPPSHVNCKCTSIDCTSVCAAHMYTHSLRRRTLVFIASVLLKPRQIYAYTHTGYHSLRRETPFFVPARICDMWPSSRAYVVCVCIQQYVPRTHACRLEGERGGKLSPLHPSFSRSP